MIKVGILGTEAVIEDYVWKSKDKNVLFLLNSLLSSDGPSGADPYPDLTVAEAARDTFGAVIGKVPKTSFNPNVIY